MNNLYDIESYGADYSVEHLVTMLERKDIEVPDFQRKYVWNLKQASRFVESCILGLPIPSFFFFAEQKGTKYLVVDGQQRIMTLFYFKSGYFKDEKTIFRLTGVAEDLEGRTYEELNTDIRRRFDYALMRITIFKQTTPSDNINSVYEVFSRLNTGGLKLTAHEVRNAVIRGKINAFIQDLNRDANWRKLYGKTNPDIHMKDEELILRFLALRDWIEKYDDPMADFLNEYMRLNKDASQSWFSDHREYFEATVGLVLEVLGNKAFRLKSTLNSAMCDSIMVSFSRNIEKAKESRNWQGIRAGYQGLIKDQDYVDAIETGTSQPKKVNQRVFLVEKYLFGKK